MVTPQQRQAALLALVHASMLALLKVAEEEGSDEVIATASTIDGVALVDLVFSGNGVPMHGESL